MAFKIYTKTGDKGQTSLIGGTRLPKHHIRIEAYGTVDELNSHIGLLRDVIEDKFTFDLLISIQDRLFTIGSHLAADPEKNKMQLPPIFEDDVVALENAIDKINDQVPEMKSFVLPATLQDVFAGEQKGQFYAWPKMKKLKKFIQNI
jgi:cob(I)alamin adenosyltransferase